MADERSRQDRSRHSQAPREAREEGQVARSRELASFALLAAGFYGTWLLAEAASGGHLQAMLRGAFTFDRATAFDTSRMLSAAGSASLEGFAALLPILALTGVAALLAPMALGGWLISSKTFELKFDRLNPISGLGRIFSIQGPIQLGMSFAKTLVVGGIGSIAIWRSRTSCSPSRRSRCAWRCPMRCT